LRLAGYLHFAILCSVRNRPRTSDRQEAVTARVEHLYASQIKLLTVAERLELLALMTQRLADEVRTSPETTHSINELEG